MSEKPQHRPQILTVLLSDRRSPGIRQICVNFCKIRHFQGFS